MDKNVAIIGVLPILLFIGKIIDLLQLNINLFKLKLGYKGCYYSDEVLDRDSK